MIPPRLRTGDLIGLVAPASPVSDDSLIERGVRYLERLGYQVILGRHVRRRHGYLAGTDQERCDDLHEMFRDRRVNAVMALRGGYGSPRLLPLLDYPLITRHPKVLVGFSDLTSLQLALWKECGLVTFHGPMLASDFSGRIDPFTEELFWRLVTSPIPVRRLSMPARVHPVPLRPGRARGRLLGGNLSMVVNLLGTRYLPDLTDALLLLEEVGEEPYRVDRMLTQLRNASVLRRTSAILAGSFADCVPLPPSKPSLAVDDILQDLARQIRKPFLSRLPFGHTSKKLTLPIGVMASVDAGAGRISILEPAVK